jgi:hypothetical protein
LKELLKENHGYSGIKGAILTGVRLKRRINGAFQRAANRRFTAELAK